MAVEPLDHETHKDLPQDIRDTMDLIRDHLSEIKQENRDHYKEVREILIEIARNTES
jgi:hypothetical protein